jgi:hypothetical protein
MQNILSCPLKYRAFNLPTEITFLPINLFNYVIILRFIYSLFNDDFSNSE